jgi:predicted transcriptional regulator YheO
MGGDEMSEMSTDTLSRIRRSEASALKKHEVFDLLKDVGLAITSMLGRSCEVVIHDVSDLEHSIIWIEGNVTGRKVGGMMSDLGLERLRKGEIHPLFNYTTYTESGRTLKSCSMWLRDSEGEIYGAFCINLDVTPIEMVQDFIRDLSPDSSRLDVSETHAQDLHDLLDTMIAEAEYRIGTPAKEMSKDQRMETVRFLDDRGAFQVRNSVVIVASALGVTRKTIYNYLGEVQRDRAEVATVG